MRVAADEQAAARSLFMAMIAGRERGGYIELRWREAEGWRRAFHATHAYRAAADHAGRLTGEADVYVGAVTRLRKEGTAAACGRAWALWADLDADAALDKLAAFAPRPTFLIESGGRTDPGRPKLHAWWALKTPLTGDSVVRAAKRLRHHLGGDNVCDLPRVMRVPGTLSHKSMPPRVVTCIDAEMVVYEPRAVIGNLPDPPGPPPPARPLTDRPAGEDTLGAIPASVYVPLLTGREPNRDGKVRCPFHGGGQERTPSLHIYDNGWACFGCDPLPGAGRDHLGGDIYVFAALLWRYRLPVRGRTWRCAAGSRRRSRRGGRRDADARRDRGGAGRRTSRAERR